MIDKKSKLVTFDKSIATASSHPEDDEDDNDAVTPADEQFQFRPETYYKERIGTEFAHGYTDRKLQHYIIGETDKKQFEKKRNEHYKEETPYVEN